MVTNYNECMQELTKNVRGHRQNGAKYEELQIKEDVKKTQFKFIMTFPDKSQIAEIYG